MRAAFLFIILVWTGRACGQSLNDYEYNKVQIVDTAQEIQADILPYNSPPKPRSDRYYYWYRANAIHASQGGFGGQLLNGRYIAYYADKSLKEQGNFKLGLKEGVWNTWNRKGELTSTITWHNGLITSAPVSFWRKLLFLKKNTDEPKPAKPGTSQ